MRRRVLLVDDDTAVREALCQTLELADIEVIAAASFIEAKDHIAPDFGGIVLSDIRMPGRDGFFLLDHTRNCDAELPVILLTGEGDIPMAVAALGRGAFGFLEKPCAPSDLLVEIERALKTRALVLENRGLKARLEVGDPAARMLFGSSDLAERLRRQVREVAQAEAEVLVSGPPGSGISKVAEVIHLLSARGQRPFEKRASAGLSRDGFSAACEAARGGSLFLDEITAMPMDTQFAVVDRLEQDAQLRVIAGCSSDAQAAVQNGTLNPDLFYRLDVMRVRIPSLAERPEDIAVLFAHYVAQASEQAGLRAPEITNDVVADLMAQDWPGNARALMSTAMRFVLGVSSQDGNVATDGVGGLGLSAQMAQVERTFLVSALVRAQGRASVAAGDLKLPRKTFYDKLARYRIRPEDYRTS
ncbi:MAG: sigma-54 dependent transcriptional regulator [Rhodobacterales bacterium]|nr:sigma-54 dependent transcriptional regulator [Rhodobacterales bacterium]